MGKKLDAYRGLLTPAQIAEGINAARGNAARLADDAAALLENGSSPTAASLAALAIEESGKESILRSLSLAQTEEEARELWKDYRSHTRKNALWLFREMILNGATKLEDFGPLFSDKAEHPYLLDQVKQLGLYTDCLGKAHWSKPGSVINSSLATALVERARILSSKKPCVAREIELWQAHMAPVRNKTADEAKQAVIDWYAAMQAENLAPEGENRMETFVRTGLLSR